MPPDQRYGNYFNRTFHTEHRQFHHFITDITDGEVKTPDLASNAVTAGKIKDGEIKAAEIARDAVVGSELPGVARLVFNECKVASEIGTISVDPGGFLGVNCPIKSVDDDDVAIANNVDGGDCFGLAKSTCILTGSKCFW